MGQTSALPVSSFDTYDASVPPGSGPDYLRRVQLEAAQCERIAVCRKKPDESTNVYLPEIDQSIVTSRFYPSHEKIPVEEQRKLISQFSNLRQEIDRRRKRLSEEDVKRMRQKFPGSREFFYWRKYCLNIDAYSSESVSSSEDDEGMEIVTQYRKSTRQKAPATGSEPSLKLLLSLNQKEMIQLLRLHVKWIKSYGVTDRSCQWIYSILSCVEKPLQAESYSVLRQVSRILSACRKDLSQTDDEKRNSITLIICIIGRYFNQSDLVDA